MHKVGIVMAEVATFNFRVRLTYCVQNKHNQQCTVVARLFIEEKGVETSLDRKLSKYQDFIYL